MISLLIFAVSYSYGLYEPKYWSIVFIDYTVKRRHSQRTYTHTPMNTRIQTLSLWVSSKIETENSQNWRSHPRRLAVDGKNSVLVQRHINHMFPLRKKKLNYVFPPMQFFGSADQIHQGELDSPVASLSEGFFSFLYLKKLKFQKYMAVSKIFR